MTSSAKVDSIVEPEMNPNFLLVLSIIVLGTIFSGIAAFWINHPLLQYPDQSMYLAMADQFLNGKKPYVDMVDFNPPLIMYISIVPALIARALHIHIILAFNCFTLGLIMLSMILAGIIMYQERFKQEAFFYLPLLIGFLMSSQNLVTDFGQREHFLLITYFPFFILRYFRWQNAPINRYLAICCGLYAALCLSLKPHFLLIAAAPELVYLLQNRRWRTLFAPEVLAVAALGMLYAVHFVFLDPSVLDQFFNFVVPLVKNGYDYYTVSLLKTLADFGRDDSYLLALILIVALLLRRACPFIAPVAAFTLGSLAIYLVALQNWSHHWLPVSFGMRVIIALVVAVIIKFLSARSLINLYMMSILGGVALIVYVVGTLKLSLPDPVYTKYFDLTKIGMNGRCPYDDLGPWADVITNYSKIGEPILFISDAIAPGYPGTLQTFREPASRYMHGMPLMMAQYLAKDKMVVENRPIFLTFFNRIIDEYAADIAKNKPALIVIRNSGIIIPLDETKFIQTYMCDYEKVDTIDEHFIYRRKP